MAALVFPPPDGHGVEPADAKFDAIGELSIIEAKSRWWKTQGLWAIETCNGNSWDSLKRAVLMRSSADIIIAQETNILSDGSINAAQRQARRLGWNPILSRAHRTSVHHGSGGSATLARAGIGIAPVAQSCLHEDLQHRLQVT